MVESPKPSGKRTVKATDTAEKEVKPKTAKPKLPAVKGRIETAKPAVKARKQPADEAVVTGESSPKKVKPAKGTTAAQATPAQATKAKSATAKSATAKTSPATPVAAGKRGDGSEKKPASRRKVVAKPAAPSVEERQRWIATAAYHRAEKRGFAPGYEMLDWLEAEAEIDALIGKA